MTVISKIGEKKPKADACLITIYGNAIGRIFRLKKGEIVIGRSTQSQLQIDHESVSRRHARIAIGDNAASIADLGSTNGTYVNDEQVHERLLRDGDLIKVGRTILKYLSNDNIEAAYHDEIYKLTTVDGLTRCYNSRYLKDELMREVSRAARYGRDLSMTVLDIDKFKDINDEYGHLAGDAILAQIGKRLALRVRREDTLARTAGGEFVLISPEIKKADAIGMAQRISRILSDGSFGFEDLQIPVSISMGVVEVAEIEDLTTSDSFASTDTTPVADYDSSSESAENERFLRIHDQMYKLGRARVRAAKNEGGGCIVSS